MQIKIECDFSPIAYQPKPNRDLRYSYKSKPNRDLPLYISRLRCWECNVNCLHSGGLLQLASRHCRDLRTICLQLVRPPTHSGQSNRQLAIIRAPLFVKNLQIDALGAERWEIWIFDDSEIIRHLNRNLAG